VSAFHERTSDTELLLFVRVTPKSAKDAIGNIESRADGKSHLKIRVRAAPEDGKANAAVETLLAKALNVPRRNVRVITGHHSRQKQAAIMGDASLLAAQLAAFPRANKSGAQG
jgi:uncharacterized protein